MSLASSLTADVPGWPKPGVAFKDIIPLLASPEGLRQTVDAVMASAPGAIDVVVGMEARRFIFAAPVALALGAGFVPVRKPGKLPRPVLSGSSDLECGTTTFTMHADALVTGTRVLIVDNVLATGGTVIATTALLKRPGTELAYVSVLLKFTTLDGRGGLAD